MAKRLFTLAIMSILALSAWADNTYVTPTTRTATDELFRLERQGDHAVYFISGGSFLKSNTLGATGSDELTNTWQVNADDRYIGFTLPTGITFQQGDIITVTGGLNGNYGSGRGFTFKDGTSDASFSKVVDVESSYKANKRTTVSYTLTEGDAIIGKSSLYVYRAGTNAYVEKVTITRSGADDMVPEAVSEKTWDLFSLAQTNNRSGNYYNHSAVNENLFYAKEMREFKQSSNPLRWGLQMTSEATNEFDFTTAEKCLGFMLPAGTHYITVYYVGNINLKVKTGTSTTTLTGTEGTNGADGSSCLVYSYTRENFDTPVFITRNGSSNTTITKIIVSESNTVTEIASVNISGLTVPVKDENLKTLSDLSTETEGVTISCITWNPEATIAAANTIYTATITMTANTSYQFASEVSANAISEKNASVTRNSDTQISVAYTFDATSADLTDISSATVTLSQNSFPYTGEAQAPTINSVVLNEITLTANDDYTVDITGQTIVGNYTATVTGIGAYTGTATANWSITQATNTLSGTLSIEGWTYGSAANSPSGVTAAFGDVAYKYSDAVDGTYGTYEEKVNGAVGTWWVKAYVDGTDNYTAVESDAVSFTISPATPVNPTLTVTQPSKGGTIAADHSGEVASGTQVTITVTPTDGYQIKSGTLKYTYNDGEDHEVAIDENTKTFSMPAYNINVTAEFEPITFTISYYGLEGANLGGMNPENYTVETDDFTLINPTKDNAEFAGWTGTELNAASTSVTISKGSTGNREYTATWTDSTPTSYTLTPTVSGNGEIHVVANNTTTKIDSATEYDAGTQVQLVAVPNDGYQLSTWSGDLANNDIPSSIWLNAKNMTSNVNLTATFVAQPETVESISESRSWTFGSFAAGTKLSGTKTYHYNGLYICGHNQNHQNLAGIETAGSNSVAFEDGPTVNYQNYLWLAGGQSPNNAGAEPNVFVRDYVAFKVAVPGTVYVYMGGKTNNYCRIYSGGTLKTTDTALTSDNTPGQYKASVAAGEVVRIGTNSGAAYIYAIAFVPASYTFKATSGSNGSITVMKGEDDVTEAVATEGGSTYNYGTSFTLTATANDGYHFVNWTDGEESVISISNPYTISSLSANTTLKANFEADAHVHNFNYTVGTGDNTNILTATCQNTSCNLTESKATLTLTADGGTYNGSAFSASTNLDVFNSATGLGATVSINYTGDNSYNSTDAPANAGTYIATATVTIGDTNYTLNKSFTIAKASITELTITELDAPVKGTALDTEVVCSTTGIESASVVWKKGETDATGNAEASTVYTAIVTLTASSNYVFAESPTVNAISEKAGAVTRNNDTQISVAYTFDATTADDPVTHTLTVNVDDASHGSVTIIVAGEAASSGVAVAEGASVSVTATANSGYTFKNWGNTELTANPYNFTMGTSDVNLTATFEEESKVNAEQTWTFNSITTGTQYKSIVEIGNGLYIRGSNGRSLSVSESDAAETITFSDNHEEEVSKTLVAANVPNGNAPTTAGNANGILGTIALNINTAGTLYIKLKAGNFDNHTDNPRLRLQNSLGTLNQVTPTDGTTIHELKYSFENASVAYLNTAGNIFLNIYAIRFVPTPEATITADATQSKTYNGTAQALTASASAGGVTITYYTNADHSEGETTTAPTNAGTYYAIVSQSDANYTSTPVNVTFTILPKDLTITAMNQTVSIGGSITEGVGLVTTNGLVEGDELTGITLDASSTEAATESGTITPSNAVIKNSASNYNISYVTGTLTVVAGTQSYNIVVPSAVNGNSVSANPTSATEGTGITLTITTAENYTLSSINADNNVELSGSGETRTFTMPAANVTITATWTINQADTGDNATSETYTVTETGGIEVSSVTTNINSSSITIPAKVGSANVTSIANDAFDNVAKENIRSIDLSATSITGVTVNRSSGIFNGFPEETMIYMPAGNTEASGQKNVIIGGTCSDFVMTDEKSYNIPTSFTAMSATLSRSFTSDVTCTLCLPYAIPAATIASFGKIYYFSGINGTTIQMTEQTGDLEANTPYIFVPNNAATGITTTGSISVSMSDAETHNNTAKFTFKGVYEHKVFSSTEISSGVYGFAADADHGAASVGQFVKASNGAWTEGMRAYLEYSEGDLTGTASTRGEGLPDVLNVVLIHANGSTTNIGRLELMTAEDGSPVYNLNGQRVDNSYKGLVIKNGKKVVVK